MHINPQREVGESIESVQNNSFISGGHYLNIQTEWSTIDPTFQR